MSWHIDARTWSAYDAGRLTFTAEMAVETHVIACPQCRAGARELTPDPEPLWQAISAEISRPRLPAPLRALSALGVPEDDLVVLNGARDLLLSWSVAVGAAVVCAVVTGLAPSRALGGSEAFFLMLAPLVPVLAVAATYDTTDPLREVTDASPFSKLRLALLRTAAALAAAIPLTVAVALSVPGVQGYFATWLLPGLALTVVALILLTWIRAWVACAVTGIGWIVGASIAAAAHSLDAVTTTIGQASFAVAVLVLTAMFIRTADVQRTGGVLR